jgi:hypothetical protein
MISIETTVVINIVKRKEINFTRIIFVREMLLDKMINSEPSSRPSRKITTAVIEQQIESSKIEKLCKSKTVLFHNAVEGKFTNQGTNKRINDKYNQYKPIETQIDFRLIIFCCTYKK